ncbi:MAG TPA: hypothetical protein VEY08_16380 [Chloroflexia bacterium]|nr:hypothetical protein [Chloroflexia bacterium]
MRKLNAIWQATAVQLTCGWCWNLMEALDMATVAALGQATIRCGNCGQVNTLPSQLLALAKNVPPKVDPDNPPGRATAWDGIVGNIVLKRALEVAIVGHHTLTYVGHPENGWAYVQQILGPLAFIMQKCPCGNYLDPLRECTCELAEIEAHRKRKAFQEALNSDIIVEAQTPRETEFFSMGEPYMNVLARIKRVRDVQVFTRAHMWPGREALRNGNPVFDLLNMARTRLGFTAEQLKKVQYVARTIADMDGKPIVEAAHMAEAIQYRTPLLEPV